MVRLRGANLFTMKEPGSQQGRAQHWVAMPPPPTHRWSHSFLAPGSSQHSPSLAHSCVPTVPAPIVAIITGHAPHAFVPSCLPSYEDTPQ